jgi:thymidylate synthase
MTFESDDYETLQRDLLGALLTAPEARPRGMAVREMLGVTLRLGNPRSRTTTSPSRAANYGFASGEFLWYLRGAEDLESICYYNKRMREFSDDGKRLHSAYGRRLRAHPPGRPSQWQDVVAELLADPDSRRAVMTIYAPSDMRRARDGGTKDVPCTLALQFFIRGKRLHLHVTMRSNDAVWGLCNDLFSFTLLQEVMLLDLRAAGLDVTLGEYIHTAGSMHLYERHYEMAAKVAAEEWTLSPAMPPLTSPADLDELVTMEKQIREGGPVTVGDAAAFQGGESWLFFRLLSHRDKARR